MQHLSSPAAPPEKFSAADTIVMAAVPVAGPHRRQTSDTETAAAASDPSHGDMPRPSLSVVIPLFNSAPTIAGLVEEVFHEFADEPVEVVLVNDGSSDETESVARRLVELYQGRVLYVQLTRNFGEHPAVLAGMELARGRHVAVIDDDGQNPPAEIRRLRDTAVARRRDVVYGRYLRRRHSPFRRLVSGLHNRTASWLFDKPCGLYLSSFKVLNRFAVNEICRSAGPFPHLDGLILQFTRNIDQIEVLHRPRRHGRSGYTPAKLTRVWLDFMVGNANRLFRPALFGGAALTLVAVIGVVVGLFAGEAGRTACLVSAAAAALGVVLFYLGLLGECLGRAAAACANRPPFVVRYLYRGGDSHA
jgi:glycosyltransferase involved in cell wall biosynthesis